MAINRNIIQKNRNSKHKSNASKKQNEALTTGKPTIRKAKDCTNHIKDWEIPRKVLHSSIGKNNN